MSTSSVRDPIEDSAELYAACRAPDSGRQDAAYQQLWRYLYRVAFFVVRRQPAADALAQDCAQRALLRIHQRLDECREPAAFKTWSRRIVTHIAIDELRRRRRLVPLELPEDDGQSPARQWTNPQPRPSEVVLERMSLAQLRELLNLAPISDRSRRVVIGRYLDDLPDETLAQQESQLAKRDVQPSHIQVTRAKNMAKLRNWEMIRAYLQGE